MHKPETVQVNETYKILWDFLIESDQLIFFGTPDLTIINKKKKEKKRTCRIVDLAVPADHRVKTKEKRIH